MSARNASLLPDPVVPVVSLVILLGAGLIFRWWKTRSEREQSPIIWQHGVFSCLVLITYLLLMQIAGFSYIVATVLFIPALAFVFGARSAKSLGFAAVLAVALSIACFLVFTKVLVIDLP